MRPTHYQTGDGTMIPTPRPLHPVDVLTGVSYFAMRVLDAAMDTANMGYAMLLSHRDAIDHLRQGLEEVEQLTSGKFIVTGDEYGQAWQDGIEEGYVAFEVDDEDE